MNHDYEHCIDFERNCPKECFRAQLVRDLSVNIQYREISWMHFKGGAECLKTQEEAVAWMPLPEQYKRYTE